MFRFVRSPPTSTSTSTQLTPRQHKTLDVLTLFHAPTCPASLRVLSLLEAASVKQKKPPFELEVLDAPLIPTPDQLRSVLEFVGADKAGLVLKGATGKRDAMRALEMAGPGISERVLRPLLVDWSNGRAGEFARSPPTGRDRALT